MMITLSEDNIRKFCHAAPWGVLYCPKCIPSLIASHGIPCTLYNWSFTLKCSNCSISWTICRECKNQNKHMTTTSASYSHNYRYHGGTKRNAKEIEDSNMSNVKRCCHESYETPLSPVRNLSGSFNQAYFAANRLSCRGNAFLVGQSQFKLSNIIDEIADNEVELHTNISTLTATLTVGQQQLLGNVFCNIAMVMKK